MLTPTFKTQTDRLVFPNLRDSCSDKVIYGFLIIIIGFFSVTSNASGQGLNDWQAYTSFSTVNGITQDQNGDIWATTAGGVFTFDGDTIRSKLTTLDGLSSLEATAIVYDEQYDRVILGYLDGTIDFINTDDRTVQTQNDIRRAERFSPRGINDFTIKGDTLFVATDFGIVLYDLTSSLVQSTFIKLGRFSTAITVNDIYIENQRIYCATREGVAVGELSRSLGQPDQWINHDNNNGFVSQSVQAVIASGDTIWAASGSNNYRYDGQQWQTTGQYGPSPILEWQALGDEIYGISEDGIYSQSTNADDPVSLPQNTIVRSFLVTDQDDRKLWVGSGSQGLVYKNVERENFMVYKPDGPWLNFFSEVNSTEQGLLATSELEFPSISPFGNEKGYYLFNNGQWQNYNTQTNQTLKEEGFSRVFTSAVSDEYYYLGSWGAGVAMHQRETDSIRVFNADNSNLRGLGGDYIVAAGIDVDANSDVWVTSYLADRPLYYMQHGSGQWQGIPKYSFLSTNDHYYHLFIDSFGQKWISLLSSENNGRGLLVIDTGEDPTDVSDDQAVKLTENPDNGNLPSAKVNVILEDKDGEIWIGTARGVARFIIPDRVIRGGSADRRAQWLINADTSAQSPFLLRDINATSMAVNAANQKWIGTAANGVWLVNQDGSKIIEHFTAQNSPLLSDQVNSISIESETGTVYFSTDKGLVSYTDVPKASVEQMESLNIYPNPFSYEKHNNGVIIDNLSDATTVRILSVDGQLVEEIDASGGRIRWDGKDGRGRNVATGIYLIVAIGDDGDKAIGKIAIIK